MLRRQTFVFQLLCLPLLLAISLCCAGFAADTAEDNEKSIRTPNILFAIADDWGYHASVLGTPWIKTPAVDRVARDGLRFTHAYTPNAKCAPSRAALLTGRNSWQLKEAANHICYFPIEFKGWCETLAENGWTVGHTAKGWGPGVAEVAHGKPRSMAGVPFNQQLSKPLTSGMSNNNYSANFSQFLEAATDQQPWCFWYGALEPHRSYEFGSGVKMAGKQTSMIERVPAYWPDTDTVRHDMLDYAFEVEHFDRHLGAMLLELEQRGQLDNTLVIVTSDHGMPFPHCKGGAYVDSNHVPLFIMWKQGIAVQNRQIDDYISFVDLAPTLLEVAGISWQQSGMAPSPGRSLTDIFRSGRSGQIHPQRDHVLIGMERHDIGRPHDAGYPIRGIVQDEQLLLENFEASRWPACNPETGYLNVDASPTKTLILTNHRANANDQPWRLCFGKRPREEFYDLRSDPDCVQNLADRQSTEARRELLRSRMHRELAEQGDPRMMGNGEVFDNYVHANAGFVGFYERFMRGEIHNTPGWVNKTDFEPEPLD